MNDNNIDKATSQTYTTTDTQAIARNMDNLIRIPHILQHINTDDDTDADDTGDADYAGDYYLWLSLLARVGHRHPLPPMRPCTRERYTADSTTLQPCPEWSL